MKLIKPTSDKSRQQFLNTATRNLYDAIRKTDQEIEEDSNTPFGSLTERIGQLRGVFDQATKDLRISHAVWQRKTKERLVLNTELGQCARDFMAVLKRRTIRYKHDPSVLSLYKAPTDGKFPHPTQLAAWEVITSFLIEGEETAIAQGYEPMSNPPITEVQEHVAKINEAQLNVTRAKTAKKAKLKALQKLREEVDEVREKLYHMLSAMLSNEGPSERRDIFRDFGFEFKGSTQDEEPITDEPVAETDPVEEIAPQVEAPAAVAKEGPLTIPARSVVVPRAPIPLKKAV